MLHVVTFCYKGRNRDYGPWHVENLRRMLEKHLTVPHRFVCVSDDPDAPGYWPIWPMPPVHCPKKSWNGNYVKLGVFGDPGRAIGDRILLLDVDTCIRGNIDDLITDDPIKVLRYKGLPHLNSGMVLLNGGSRPDIWLAAHSQPMIDAAFTEFRGTDQSLMSKFLWPSMLAGFIPMWTETDGISVGEHWTRWRLFHGAGWQKPWMDGHPARQDYLRESGRL